MLDYFAYGSNLDFSALRAKGVVPLDSTRATLPGWRIRFNVTHFFRHEGGVANIEPTCDGGDRVLGVVHRLEDEALAALDAAELYPDGYDRTSVVVETDQGPRKAITYIGTPAFVDDTCLPSRRLVAGFFGGRDMTTYHLRLLETSDGTDDDEPAERTPAHEAHLNTLLWSYAEEYRYVGRLGADE